MSKITFIRPVDQPTGSFRLLDWLENNFQNNNYQNFRCLVAFAKIKPFYKLHSAIQSWNSTGKTSEAIIGVDHKGTSYQALQYAMENFDVTRILHVNHSTFHPKLYIFYGPAKAIAYYGSSNLTSGGLETNFEGGVIIKFDLPTDKAEFDELFKSYSSLLAPTVSCTTILTPAFLSKLQSNDLLLDETKKNASSPATPTRSSTSTTSTSATSPLFGSLSIKPARPIPKSIMTSAASSGGIVLFSPTKTSTSSKKTSYVKTTSTTATSPALSAPTIMPLVVDGFVTQIAPHNNGEIHLSKLGVDQNRTFFGYPFTGMTIPKKATNPAYPQRYPDPVVNINVFDSAGALVHTETNYNLNMVYYTTKSEIRITITPSILSGLAWTLGRTNFPILVMKFSDIPGINYELEFYASGSASYNSYLAICNQTLPSGGNSIARKMGWY